MAHGSELSSGHGRTIERRAWRGRLRAAGREDLGDLLDPVARRAASGDHDALEDLIWAVDELHLARSAVRRLVVQDADAEEVEQDVLVAVAESIRGFRGEARFTTWLHQLARHKAIAQLRRRKDAVALADEVGDAARIVHYRHPHRARRGHRRPPRPLRDAVVLRDVEQRPYSEVAERLGLNLNTVKARVARGRALAAANLRAGS